MSCLTDLSQIKESLIRRLTQLDHATCLLRGLCDDDFLRSPSPSRLRKLWAAANCLFSGAMGVQIPPSLAISDGGDSKNDKNDWIERYLSVVGKLDSPEAAAIGFLWMGHARGVEHFLGHALPPDFVDAVRSGKDEIRNAWAIWFLPKSSDATALFFETPAELERLRQIGGWREYRHAGTRWDSVRDLLKREGWRASWPSAGAAIKKAVKTCRDFEQQGKTDFIPTVQEIEDAAVGLVMAHHEPWMPGYGMPMNESDKTLVEEGLRVLPEMLRVPFLIDEIEEQFAPRDVSDKQINEVLGTAIDARRLCLARIQLPNRNTKETGSVAFVVPGRSLRTDSRGRTEAYQPTQDDLTILQVLDASPTPLRQIEIDAATELAGNRVARRTLCRRLPILLSQELIYRPNGPRIGVSITTTGKSVLERRQSGGKPLLAMPSG